VGRSARSDHDRVAYPISLSVGAHAHWRLVALRVILPTERRARKSMSIDISLDKDTNKVCCTHQFSLLNRLEKSKQLVEAENIRVLS
jgi:hypothetical protein